MLITDFRNRGSSGGGGTPTSSVQQVSSYSTLPGTGTVGIIYITTDTMKQYLWDTAITDYVQIADIHSSDVLVNTNLELI